MTSPSSSDIRDAAYASMSLVSGEWGEVVQESSTKRFIAVATDISNFDHYKFFPEPARHMLDALRTTSGDAGARAFLRAVLLQAVIDLIDNKSLENLPPKVSQHQRAHLYRIAMDARADMDWLDISHDYFHKEFGLTTLRLYAAGAQLVDVRCGIPRSILFTQGLQHAPSHLLTMARLGGFKPYFSDSHTQAQP